MQQYRLGALCVQCGGGLEDAGKSLQDGDVQRRAHARKQLHITNAIAAKVSALVKTSNTMQTMYYHYVLWYTEAIVIGTTYPILRPLSYKTDLL